MLIAVMFLLSGAGRSMVGTGSGPKWIGRWSVYPPIALLSAYTGLDPILSLSDGLLLLWLSVGASPNLAMGYTQWESWKHMAVRFGLPALLTVLPVIVLQGTEVVQGGIYLTLAVLAGLFYPHRQRVFEFLRLDRLSYSWLDSSRLAEFVAGACVLGGLSIL